MSEEHRSPVKPKKGSIAALILGQMKGTEKEEDPEESEESDNDEGLVASAEEMMRATKDEDAKGFVMALKAFIEQCS